MGVLYETCSPLSTSGKSPSRAQEKMSLHETGERERRGGREKEGERESLL